MVYFTTAHPTPNNNEKTGQITIHGNHERRQGSTVQIQAQKDLYVSKDGHTRVYAEGQASRNWGGPNSGRTHYGGGIRLERRWKRSPADEPRPNLINLE